MRVPLTNKSMLNGLSTIIAAYEVLTNKSVFINIVFPSSKPHKYPDEEYVWNSELQKFISKEFSQAV